MTSARLEKSARTSEAGLRHLLFDESGKFSKDFLFSFLDILFEQLFWIGSSLLAERTELQVIEYKT
jgi:hypothetical protein